MEPPKALRIVDENDAVEKPVEVWAVLGGEEVPPVMLVGSKLDECRRRLFAASEVRAAGRGGLEAVSQITGLECSTIGLKDLDAAPQPKGRVRR